jgi:2-polyprenyl-3-methyl-5-hydroxy-6-metoxy-1,4-benzoquinol methylase
MLVNVLSRTAWHTLSQNRRLLAKQQRSLLSEFDGKRILEIGSGQRRGSNLFQSAVKFAPAGAEFQMTDVDPSLGHSILDIRTPDQTLRRFDLVLCCNVLEHVDNLGAAVSGLASVCENDGLVFASTPFIYPYHDEPGDFWRPTAHGLKFIFEREFDEVAVNWTGLRRFPFQLFVQARRPRR